MNRLTMPLLASLLLAGGCATPAYVSPVEVTRFTGESDAFLGQGTITIAPAPGTDSRTEEYEAFHEAVRRELEALGYRVVLRDGAQMASLAIDQSVREAGARRGPVSVGVGGSTGSYGSGVGLGIGLDLSGREADRIETRLGVTIRASDGATNLWEGRASMAASDNSEYAAPEDAAARLAAALFEGFPGSSGETIAVP